MRKQHAHVRRDSTSNGFEGVLVKARAAAASSQRKAPPTRRKTPPKRRNTAVLREDDQGYADSGSATPKLFMPRNAPWINKRLYGYLEKKLYPKFNLQTLRRSEEFLKQLYDLTKQLYKKNVNVAALVDSLKKKMALLGIVTTHFEFGIFVEQYVPLDFKIRIVPDHVNDLPVPSDIFSNILEDSDSPSDIFSNILEDSDSQG